MKNKKNMVRILSIFILALGIIIWKDNQSMAAEEKTYKLGDGEIVYNNDGETITTGIGSTIENVSNYEALLWRGQTKEQSFYCVSKDKGLPTEGEEKNNFSIYDFIEIGPNGYGIIRQGAGGDMSTSLNEWGGLGDEYYYKYLYYILSQGDAEFGYNINGARQNAVWEKINMLMLKIFGHEPGNSSNNKAYTGVNISELITRCRYIC